MANKTKRNDALFPDGDWRFRPHAGVQHVDGKTHYPALLRLELTKRDALQLIESLARFANVPGLDTLEFPFCGTIERLEET